MSGVRNPQEVQLAQCAELVEQQAVVDAFLEMYPEATDISRSLRGLPLVAVLLIVAGCGCDVSKIIDEVSSSDETAGVDTADLGSNHGELRRLGSVTEEVASMFDRLYNVDENRIGIADKDGLAFHVDADTGKPIYSQRFRYVSGFDERGMAIARGLDGSAFHRNGFHIGRDGAPIYAERYDFVGPFIDDIAVAEYVEGNREISFHIGRDGKPIYDERFDWVGPFSEGAAPVSMKDEYMEKLHYHIGVDGKPLYNPYKHHYKRVTVFHNGAATAVLRGDTGEVHIGFDGEPLYPETYDYVRPFYRGVALVVKNGEEFHIRMDGSRVATELLLPGDMACFTVDLDEGLSGCSE